MKRRRFLCVAAGFAAFPALATAKARWEGIALGAHARIELAAPPELARPALRDAVALLEEVERVFSLYRPDSLVSRLNRDGAIADAPDLYWRLHDIVDHLHAITGGLFDPTVQARWRALATGRDGDDGASEGWTRLSRATDGGLRLGPGQQVTFNGIAQGFATDLVVAALKRRGLRNAFVDLGEQAAFGSARRLGLVDPVAGRVGDLTLRGGAIATSSPAATPLGRHGHILRPRTAPVRPHWSTVSVEAEHAALADGLSTAMVHANLPMVRHLRHVTGVRRVFLVDWKGNLRSL